MFIPNLPDMVMISARAMTTLGVPLPTVIKKSGICRPLARVRVKSHAITHDMAIPAVAATEADMRLFFAVSGIPLRVNKMFQYRVVKFAAESGLPRFFVNDVSATVANGITTTISANIATKIVTGVRHFPSSTMFGRVDLPDTVIYCFLPHMNVEMYSTRLAIIISDTANVVASVSPSAEPT